MPHVSTAWCNMVQSFCASFHLLSSHNMLDERHFRVITRNTMVKSMHKADWLVNTTWYQLNNQFDTWTSPWWSWDHIVYPNGSRNFARVDLSAVFRDKSLGTATRFHSLLRQPWPRASSLPLGFRTGQSMTYGRRCRSPQCIAMYPEYVMKFPDWLSGDIFQCDGVYWLGI